MRQDTDNYRQLFLDGVPLMDTRAPVEYSKGAFPEAVNIPLLTDSEREQVGIRYKQEGQDAAIALGETLVTEPLRETRLQAWCDFAQRNPQGYLYCFRGGLRSQTVQQWMRDAGHAYPLITGGYKAMRRFLIDELERSVDSADIVLVAGKTGAGKTRVIEGLERAIDLEALARHRGSSFGRLAEPQPTQIDFENALSISLLRLMNSGHHRVFVEDEGHLVGRISLPESLRVAMQQAPLLVVEESVERRVQVIVDDYIADLEKRYQNLDPERAAALHRDHLLAGLDRLRKRLGGELHVRLRALVERALDADDSTLADSLHRQWIQALLVEYYDPMYEYQIGRRQGGILFRGSRDEVLSAAAEMTAKQ